VKRAGLFAAVLLVAGSGAASVLADDTPPPGSTTTATTAPATTTAPTTTAAPTLGVVPDGVTLAEVPIGGLTAEAAAAAVGESFNRPAVLKFEATTITVAPAVLGLQVSVEPAIAKALTVAPGTSLSLRGTVQRPLVSAFIAKLEQRFDRKPVSSRLLLRNSKPFVTKSVAGRTLDQRPAVAELTDQVVHGTRSTIILHATLEQPQVTAKTIGPVIVIRRGSNQLTLYEGMKIERTFQVATGQTVYPTPLGRFEIVVKWRNPWWYPPNSSWAQGEKPIPPGPGNPLGTRWMGLSAPGVGIHGTPDDASIGYSVSHGCIRMHIPQAEWLFNHVDIDTPVFIVPS
jgi:lipoprotein-anchoring transpeptidase ErfK/SrfK